MNNIVIVAIGGNALIKDGSDSVQDQYKAVYRTVVNIVDMVEAGHEVVVTHGNGPQVGFIIQRSKVAHEESGMSMIPLDYGVAETQGGIGFQIQQALTNEFLKRGIQKQVATIVTQVEVDKDDPFMMIPSKPIGSFFKKEQAEKLKMKNKDWEFIEDSGRGYRRIVPSPKPINIVEKDIIQSLIRNQVLVVAVGGGGIPVVKTIDNTYESVEAVIDKDFATSLLAKQVNADTLIITTSVPKVYIHFGKPNQRPLKHITAAELKKYMDENHFAKGSMLPKIKASLAFLEQSGKKVIITSPDRLKLAIAGKAGTHITK